MLFNHYTIQNLIPINKLKLKRHSKNKIKTTSNITKAETSNPIPKTIHPLFLKKKNPNFNLYVNSKLANLLHPI